MTKRQAGREKESPDRQYDNKKSRETERESHAFILTIRQ